MGLGGLAQTRIHMYADEPLLWRDMVAHVEDGVVRLGPDWRGDIFFTLHGDRQGDEVALFQGFSTSALDVVYTLREEAPTVLTSGHASGRAPVWGLYREGSRSWSDRVALFEGTPTAAELLALLLASGWL